MRQANNERRAGDAAPDLGPNFMEMLGKELATDQELTQRADKRLREDPTYAGPERRARREEPTVSELVDHAENKFRPLLKIAAAVGPLVVVLGGWGVIANPLQTKAAAQEAQAAIDRRFESVDVRLGAVEKRLDNIDQNQRRSLILQLRQAQRELRAALETMPAGAPGRSNLADQLDAVNTDLKALGQ